LPCRSVIVRFRDDERPEPSLQDRLKGAADKAASNVQGAADKARVNVQQAANKAGDKAGNAGEVGGGSGQAKALKVATSASEIFITCSA
jgi:hypothetical protein